MWRGVSFKSLPKVVEEFEQCAGEWRLVIVTARSTKMYTRKSTGRKRIRAEYG